MPAFVGVGWLLERDWGTPRLRRGWLVALAGFGAATLVAIVHHLSTSIRHGLVREPVGDEGAGPPAKQHRPLRPKAVGHDLIP